MVPLRLNKVFFLDEHTNVADSLVVYLLMDQTIYYIVAGCIANKTAAENLQPFLLLFFTRN
jgi:ABC-type uncharacterized transport system ATPase component